MLQLTTEFKNKVIEALLIARKNYDGSDAAFAKKCNMNQSVYSRLKKGERDGLLKESQYLTLGRELNVTQNERSWNVVRTEVFNVIEEEILFCKRNSKSKIFVDNTEIGKTFTAKYLSRTLKNCFYVDASQAKTQQIFIRLIAQTIGVDDKGKYADVKANIKYYLRMLPQPIVIIDEAGDTNYNTFLELKELWNGTEGSCAWYMIGADGLRTKLETGIRNKKVGFSELFSRYSSRYSSVVPTPREDKYAFYKKLITDVLSANMEDKTKLSAIVKRCLITDSNGHIGGLRRAESLLILNS